MRSASHRAWFFSQGAGARTGAPADDTDAAEAARWLLTVLARRRNAESGGRVLITSARGAFHNTALAVAREAAQLVSAVGAENAEATTQPASGVLLIDTSQGAAALSTALQLPRSPGLAELCQYRASFEEVIHRDSVSTLHFLPSGRPRTVGGPWGKPGAADRVFRALDASYRCVAFCAEWDEALHIAETMKRPFCAAVAVTSSCDPQSSRALHEFGFPVFDLPID